MLHISSNYLILFDEDRASPYAFLYVPRVACLLFRSRTWVVVGRGEFIGLMVVAIGVDVFCFHFSIEGYSESGHSWVEIGAIVHLIRALHLAVLGQERC